MERALPVVLGDLLSHTHKHTHQSGRFQTRFPRLSTISPSTRKARLFRLCSAPHPPPKKGCRSVSHVGPVRQSTAPKRARGIPHGSIMNLRVDTRRRPAASPAGVASPSFSNLVLRQQSHPHNQSALLRRARRAHFCTFSAVETDGSRRLAALTARRNNSKHLRESGSTLPEAPGVIWECETL